MSTQPRHREREQQKFLGNNGKEQSNRAVLPFWSVRTIQHNA